MTPSIWIKAILSPIPKSAIKDLCVPINYWGISQLFSVYKVYSSILNRRVLNYLEDHVDEQNRFRHDR